MKQVIRLTESDLHRIIKESVKEILRESLEITEPSEIYNVLKNGDFKRILITSGDDSQFMVINASRDGYQYFVSKDEDGSTHTWYYPYYGDIERGVIKSIKILD